MKLRHALSLNLLLIGTVGFAAGSIAQTSPPSDDPQTPPTSDQAMKEMKGMGQTKDPLAVQGSGGEDWNALKGHEKGYVAMTDAQPNSWLAHNFKNCDKDQNGKITEAEYTMCQKPQR